MITELRSADAEGVERDHDEERGGGAEFFVEPAEKQHGGEGQRQIERQAEARGDGVVEFRPVIEHDEPGVRHHAEAEAKKREAVGVGRARRGTRAQQPPDDPEQTGEAEHGEQRGIGEGRRGVEKEMGGTLKIAGEVGGAEARVLVVLQLPHHGRVREDFVLQSVGHEEQRREHGGPREHDAPRAPPAEHDDGGGGGGVEGGLVARLREQHGAEHEGREAGFIGLAQVSGGECRDAEEHADIEQFHAGTGGTLRQQRQRAEQEDRDKTAEQAGETAALKICEAERNGQQHGVERVGVGDAVAGEVVDERKQEREKIRTLVEVVVGREKDAEDIVAAHHRGNVAEEMHVERRGLQHEFVVENFAAEGLGGERHERQQRDGEAGEKFFAARERDGRKTGTPEPPERDAPQHDGEQHDVVAAALDDLVGRGDRDSDKAEPHGGERRQTEEHEPGFRAVPKAGDGLEQRRQDRERPAQGSFLMNWS